MPLAFDDGFYGPSEGTFSGESRVLEIERRVERSAEKEPPGPSTMPGPKTERTRHRLLCLIREAVLYPGADVILWARDRLSDANAEFELRQWARDSGLAVTERDGAIELERADGTPAVTLYTRAP